MATGDLLSNSRRRTLLLVGLVLLGALAIRLVRLDFQDIWWDEARNIDVARRPVADIAPAPELDIHPPVYFYLLHVWMRLMGESAFAIRLLSVLFGVVTVAVLYQFGCAVGGRAAGVLSALVACLAPFAIGEAQEARMYTMGLAWVSLAGWCLWRAVRSEATGEWWDWVGFCLFSSLALLTHYSTLFVLAAYAVFAMLTWATAPRRRQFGFGVRVVLAGLGILVLCLPQAAIAWRQIPGYRNPNLTVPTLSEYLGRCWQAFSVGLNIGPQGAETALLVLAGLILLSITVTGVTAVGGRGKAGQRGSRAGWVWALLLLWLFLPLALYYWVLLDRSAFHPRYISFIAPAYWLLLGALLSVFWRKSRLLGAVATAALLVALIPAVGSDLTDSAFFREDASGLASWLGSAATPADLVLADQRYPLGFYYPRWNNDADGTPPLEPVDVAPAQYLFVDINHLDDRLTTLTSGKQRVFWVQWYKSDTDPRGAVDFLFRKFGTVRDEQDFRGYGVRSYIVPPDTVFRLAAELLPVGLVFGDQVELVAWDRGGRDASETGTAGAALSATVGSGQPAWAVARWRKLGGSPGLVKASVRLVGVGGELAGQDDRPLLNDRHLALSYWEAGDVPLNVYLLDVGRNAVPGDYSWQLVVYESATLTPLPWRDSSGHIHGEPATLGQIRVVGPHSGLR